MIQMDFSSRGQVLLADSDVHCTGSILQEWAATEIFPEKSFLLRD